MVSTRPLLGPPGNDQSQATLATTYLMVDQRTTLVMEDLDFGYAR